MFFGICVAFMYAIKAMATCYGTSLFDENRLLENLQCLTLLAAGGIFLVKSCICRRYSTVMALCSSLAFFAACREMDNVLDKALPIISWRIGFVFVIIAIIHTIRNARDFLPALHDFVATPAFFAMCNVMIIVVPIAQLIGHKPFLQAALPPGQAIGNIKELFEECAESIGYLLLLFASIETLIGLHETKK